jgi:hypothetical protein
MANKNLTVFQKIRTNIGPDAGTKDKFNKHKKYNIGSSELLKPIIRLSLTLQNYKHNKANI